MRFANWRKRCSLRCVGNYRVLSLLVSLLLVFSLLLLFPGSVQAAPTGIWPPILPGGQVGVAYLQTLTVTGGTSPYTWTPGALPPGLTFTSSANTATISGTPTTAGTYTFLVTVTDSGLGSGSINAAYTITITAKPITFVSTYLPEATEGASYQGNTGATGGNTPYTFTLVSGTLPSGLRLDPVSGTISGTPAKGTTGTYSITIGVTDSSTPPLSAQQSYSLVIRKGFYESVISIDSSLAAGETNVYVDGRQVAKLRGGQTTRQSFAVGTKPAITIDTRVSHPTRPDIRFVAETAKKIVDELSPDATFTYTPEYYLDLKTDPPQLTPLPPSDWYKEGSALRSSAPAQIDGTTGIQYRFSYWLLPAGDKLKDGDLSWIVNAPGKATATYDTYYQLTVTSPEGKVDGSGWYKAGTTAKWSVSPPEIPMSGILGLFRGKLKPDSTSSTEVMDAPKTVIVAWQSDYTMPAVLISALVIFLIVATFGVRRLLYPPPPKPAVAPVPPAPPTIVVVGGGQQPQLETTKDQLVEQFRQLLGKYEGEVKATVKSELPEAKLIPESQRLALPRGKTTCSHTSKDLIRTVVGNWRKTEEKIQTEPSPEQEAAEKRVSLVTVWARDIYNEWEISTCSLRLGHSGGHKCTTHIAYTLQDTVTEERTYGAKQKIAPPKPHFTDELPVVDVAHHQIIATEPASTPDQVINPDDVIPPDEQPDARE